MAQSVLELRLVPEKDGKEDVMAIHQIKVFQCQQSRRKNYPLLLKEKRSGITEQSICIQNNVLVMVGSEVFSLNNVDCICKTHIDFVLTIFLCVNHSKIRIG